MKKCFLILYVSLIAIVAWAGDQNTVLVPKYITRGQSSVIPEKTDNMKLRNLEFNQNGDQGNLVRCIQWAADSIVRVNYETNIFLLTVTSLKSGDATVEMRSFDPMGSNPTDRQQLYGVVKHAHCYLVVKLISGNELRGAWAGNQPLLKQLFKDAHGKTKFERVFELVEDLVQYGGTRFVATYRNGVFDPILEFIVNGEDLLHRVIAKPENGDDITGKDCD